MPEPQSRPSPPAVLAIEDLRVDFDTHDGVVQGVRGVSLAIPRGETLGVVRSAAPIPDPAIERSRPRPKLSGEPPSPMDPRAALRFLPSRLPVDSTASFAAPELKKVARGHLVAEFDPPSEAA
jgi:hypothetical protein